MSVMLLFNVATTVIKDVNVELKIYIMFQRKEIKQQLGP